jgi:prefoldin subunit 5
VISLQLGSGFTADFRVFEREFLLVSVGFGFFCQMRWQEAHSFALSKISFLMRKRKRIEEKLLKVEEHLKLTTEILEELAKSTTATTTINK